MVNEQCPPSMRRIKAKIYFSDIKTDRNTNDLRKTGTKTENTTLIGRLKNASHGKTLLPLPPELLISHLILPLSFILQNKLRSQKEPM